MMAAQRDENFRRGGPRKFRGRGSGARGQHFNNHRGGSNAHHSFVTSPSFSSSNNLAPEMDSEIPTIDDVPKHIFISNPHTSTFKNSNSIRKNHSFIFSPDLDGDSNNKPKNRDFTNFVFSPESDDNLNSVPKHRNFTNHVFSPNSSGDHRYSNKTPKPRNFAKGPNSPTPNNFIGPIGPGGVTNNSSPPPDGHSPPNGLCNDGSWDDLFSFVNDKFSEELDLYESLDTEVINTWCHLKEIADVGIKEMDYSAIKEVLLTRRDQLAEGGSLTAPTLLNRDCATSDEIDRLGQYFKPSTESKPTKNFNEEQEIASLKVTIRSLTTQLQKDKENFNAKLDDVQSKCEKQLMTANSTLKAEQKQNKLAQEKIKKEYEDKLETVRADYTDKFKSLKTDNQELEKRLKDQLRDIEILSNEAIALKNQIISEKKHTLQKIKEIIKDNWECSICLSIYDKAVITSCGHAFCKKCIEQWRAHMNDNRKCPNCRETCSFNSIYFFNEMVTQLQNHFPSMDWMAKEDAASPISPW